jgi:hypothetical protein
MNKKKGAKIVSVICIALFVVSVFPSQIAGQTDSTKAGDTYSGRFVLQFNTQDLMFSTLNGYDLVNLNGCDDLNEVGKPQVPVEYIRIAVPTGIQIQNVYVEKIQTEQLPGQYLLYPAQQAIPTNVAQDTAGLFVQPDATVYASTQPYPSQTIEFVGETDLAGQPIGEFLVYPIHYMAGEKTLSLTTTLTFVVTGMSGYICGDYLPKTISDEGQVTYETMIKEMVINPENVQVQSAENTPAPLALPSGGPYSHVIITSSAQSTYWQPLADWHTKRGLKDIVVTTQYIYDNYAGSTNQQEIRNFIIDAFNTWGTMYFLLAGEPTTVPIQYVTQYQESTPSDQYYSDFDDDWTHEVFVGRSTAEGATQVDLFIDKVLFYEKTPPTTDYILKTLLMGFDVDADTQMQILKENIATTVIPSRFTNTKVYDSYSGSHYTAAITAMNAGQHLINQADHGDYDWWGIGSFHHGTGMYNNNVDALTNTNKMSIVITLACLVNAFDYSDSFSEHWVIYNAMKAGVAFIGNTRLGWYYIGNPYGLSAQLDKDTWRGLFQNDKYIIGETIIWAKHQFSTTGDNAALKRHCEWQFSLLGEPAMPIWTDTPLTLTVSHPATLPTGSSSFTVHVASGSFPVSQALVCLWKGTEVYLTGTTNANGDVTFTPNPTTTGTMYITVTKHNYLPYEGTATVQAQTLDPNQSFVTLTHENLPFLVTCPAGDGPLYQHVKVTCRNAGGNPLPGIPASAFTFTLGNVDATWYGTLSCTFTAVDPQTDANGEIRFTVKGDTSIYGNITIRVTVQTVPLNDIDTLPCKSVDYNLDGDVDLGDFVMFAHDYGGYSWKSDFSGDGIVALSDLVMFAGHYGHHV